MTKEIIFDSYNILDCIRILSKTFQTKIIEDRGELKISIPPKYGDGYVLAMDFHNGLGMLMLNGSFKNNIILKYISDQHQPLRLIFCVENDFKHFIQADRLQYQLTNLLGSMVCGTHKNEQAFLISADTKICFYSIEIDRKKYLPRIESSIDSMPTALKDVFKDVDCIRPFLYQGHYSLTIAQSIQNIKINEYKGLVSRIYVESQTLDILAHQIRQFVDDLEPRGKQSMLRKKDMELIIEARNRLIADLIKPPTIKELAALTGTNENKLKKGFRLLYDTSINKLLQNERLSKAKLLIAEERHPIKEIAGMVGYKHAGHFTSKFKKKFGVLPKDYIKAMGL